MKNIILFSLTALLCASAWYWWSFSSQDTKPPSRRGGPVQVVVIDTRISPVRDEVFAIGTVAARESVVITPSVAERITALHFHDGQFVNKGQLLAELDTADQQARVEAARVKLHEQMRELARIRSLVSNQTVAELERDRLQSQLDTAKAELAAAKAAVAERHITAPFAGLLGLRQISEGSLVTPGTVMTTLDDLAVVKLDFAVPERVISQMAAGRSIEATSVAYPGRIFQGRVSGIDTRIDAATRAVTVRAEIPNPDLLLRPGMLMQLVLISNHRDAMMVPESAIIPIGPDHFVYLVEAGKVVRRQVTLGMRQRGFVELVGGIAAGEQLMVRGMMKVRPGRDVTTVAAEPFSYAGVAEEARQ